MSTALSENSATPKMTDDGSSNRMGPPHKGGTGSHPSESTEELLHQPFPPFDHSSLVVQPYRQEAIMDEEYQEQLQQKLLKLMLHFHAWSSSRPSYETTAEGEKLYQKTQEVLDKEGEQGMSSSSFFEATRLRLLDFIVRIKTALAALTDMMV